MKKILIIILFINYAQGDEVDVPFLTKIAYDTNQMKKDLKMIKKLNHKRLKIQARMLEEMQKQNLLLREILKKD